MDYRLTDFHNPDPEVEEKFRNLSLLPKNFCLEFKDINVKSEVSFSPFLGVFLNTLEVRFTNLANYRVVCEAVGEELAFALRREDKVSQKLKTFIQKY